MHLNNVLIVNGDTSAGRAAIIATRKRKMNVYTVVSDSKVDLSKDITKFELNVVNEKSVEDLAVHLHNLDVSIDILINCPSEQTSLATWEQIIDQNLKRAMLFCRIFGQRMIVQRKGRIIQLVSNVAIDPYNPKHFSEGHPSTAYAASMGGVLALSRHLAAQYQDNGVLINNIVYGLLQESEPASLAKAYAQRVPMGRAMSINDLANTLDLLLDPNSNYITGQNIVADGGGSIW